MGKDIAKQGVNRNYAVFLKGFIIEIIISALLIAVFAIAMYFFESGYNYAPLFATVSIAVGTFFGTSYTAGHIGNKGYLTGTIIGGITFFAVTLISLVINHNGLTYNTLFHFIIIMLSALISGVLGVNRKNNRKYI